MRKQVLRLMLLAMAVLSGVMSARAEATVVLNEDFSGNTNIFGVTATTAENKSAWIRATGLSGFEEVLVVSNTTAEGTISGTNDKPIDFSAANITVEWDAFHGYYGYDNKTTLSLLNSDGQVLASYTYNANGTNVAEAFIGEQSVTGFEAFSLQSTSANGWGGNGKPFNANNNPHIAITLKATGGVEMVFSRGTTIVKTLLGSVGTLGKNIAKLRISGVASRSEDTDRSYGIDNIKVTTEEATIDPNYVEPIASALIVGADKMTFGPSPNEAAANDYSVTIVGVDGTIISEDNLNEKVTDFKVVWDIDGFKTENDTEGQYCDSYGTFAVNNEGKVATIFNLRNVPMNFFGKMTATITYNGTITKAEKYVIAQGDLTKAANQVLPLAGYPVSFSDYPDALTGYKVKDETYGSAQDLLLGGWCEAGSDKHQATLKKDADGTKYIRLTASESKKSHVLTQSIASPTSQLIFKQRLRFNSTGGVVTLTSGYPFWSSSKYTCPVTLSFDGSKLTLNSTPLTADGSNATVTTGTWYDIVLSVDKTTETCYALLFNTNGQQIAESGLISWAETSNPTYYSIGMGNSNTGSIDVESYQVFVPQADSFVLTADKTTLSIPNKETASLSAAVFDVNSYNITGKATWAVQEEDMQQSIVITPDDQNSHKATVTLTETAEAGTATIQVSIGGVVKTLELNLTSSAESVKFTESITSITIPLDASDVATATFSAQLIDGNGDNTGATITLTAYDKDNVNAFTNTDAVSFDAATGTLSVKATASPMTLTIRATGQNSEGEIIAKAVRVNIHGLKFDFGTTDGDAVAEGFTAVGITTAYTDANGYGIKSGTATVGGTISATDATTDYLEGAFEFDFKATVGEFYTVEISYQGTLTTGYVNSDLTGYQLGSSATMTTATFTIPATMDIIDLCIADNDGGAKARIAQISITKQAKRQKRAKRVVHHIGDSTSANNGSWAYRLAGMSSTYTELFDLCTFQNNGAGGRNLCSYYTQGRLYSVLKDIYPDDIVMFGNNGTNGMGNSFEADMNYYLDAAEALGAKIIINSYTPHGAVSNYSSGYNSATNTFNSYRTDSYETIVRKVSDQRAANDANYLGFVEIGKNADAAFNAYVADYIKNGYASKDAAAKAVIDCFTDHNHYSNGTLACDLMLNGYGTVKGIVAQMVDILGATGDVNGDSTVDSKDVADLVNYLLGQTPDGFNESAADINGDNKIDIADITALINVVLGK